MSIKSNELISFIKKNGGIAKFSAILEAGFHPDSLNNLLKQNKITKISRGLYMWVGQDFKENPDFVISSLQAPRGVICLLSALSFHEVTVEIPKYVEIAIPKGAHAYKIDYPPVKIYHFDYKAWESGIEEYKIDGHKIKIYNLAKTIADCYKFRNRIGMNVIREALKTSLKEKKVKPKEIMKYAKVCRVENGIRPILEAIL